MGEISNTSSMLHKPDKLRPCGPLRIMCNLVLMVFPLRLDLPYLIVIGLIASGCSLCVCEVFLKVVHSKFGFFCQKLKFSKSLLMQSLFICLSIKIDF